MRAWASQGSWDIRVEFVKRLELAASVTDVVLYEVKSHQDRILFIRHKRDAIAVDATLKKNDWSKKDQHFLDAAIEVAREASAELGGGNRR